MQIYTGDDGKPEHIKEQISFGIGTMITASDFNCGRKHHYEVPIAIDNGAFSAWLKGCGFDEFKFLKLLSQIIDKKINYNFIVTPDIVAGGVQSLEFSIFWRDRLAGWQRQYLAVQDGMDVLDVSGLEHKFDGIFIGGTNEWKWKTAKEWIDFAHDNDKKCHIGRCGALDKLLYAHELGADSVDSTTFARNGDYRTIEKYYKMVGLNLFKEENETIQDTLLP